MYNAAEGVLIWCTGKKGDDRTPVGLSSESEFSRHLLRCLLEPRSEESASRRKAGRVHRCLLMLDRSNAGKFARDCGIVEPLPSPICPEYVIGDPVPHRDADRDGHVSVCRNPPKCPSLFASCARGKSQALGLVIFFSLPFFGLMRCRSCERFEWPKDNLL